MRLVGLPGVARGPLRGIGAPTTKGKLDRVRLADHDGTVAYADGLARIYSNPTGSGVAWERECSAELILPDGREGFQLQCGIRIQGGASRNPTSAVAVMISA